MNHMRTDRNRRRAAGMFCLLLILCGACLPAFAEAVPECAHQHTEVYREEGAAPSCTVDGWHEEVTVCLDCGAELARVQVTDPAAGHSWTETARTESTEMTAGSVTRTCLLCGESYTEELPPLQSMPDQQPAPAAEDPSGAVLTVPADLVYNGSSQPLVITEDEPSAAVWMFAPGTDAAEVPAEDAWSSDVPQGTDAGTYYVWYKTAGDAQHAESLPACAEVMIAPRSITVKAKDQAAGLITDGPEAAEISEGSLADGHSLSAVTLTVESGKNGDSVILPSEAKIGTAEGTDVTNNYLISYQEGMVTDGRAELSAVILESSVLIYNGKAQTVPVIKVEAVSEEGILEVPQDACTVRGNTHINAGTYTVAVTANEDSPYQGTVTTEYRIEPKSAVTLHVTLAPESAVYNGEEKEPAVNIRDGEKLLIRNRDYTFAYSDNVNAGQANAVLTFRGNYSGVKNAVFAIKKAPLEITSQPVPKTGLVYSGIRQELLERPGSLPEGCTGTEYSTDGGITWSDQIPRAKDPGDYHICWRLTGDENHRDSEVRILTARIASRPGY